MPDDGERHFIASNRSLGKIPNEVAYDRQIAQPKTEIVKVER
jgi:hypothetical protein